MNQARAAFDTLNRNMPDAGSIDKALEYLESAGFYDSLKVKEQGMKLLSGVLSKTTTLF